MNNPNLLKKHFSSIGHIPTHPPNNLSNRTLTTEELNILDKGLSFAPTDLTTEPKLQLQLLHHYDKYYTATTNQPKSLPLTTTDKIYRPIKFIPKSKYSTILRMPSTRTVHRDY